MKIQNITNKKRSIEMIGQNQYIQNRIIPKHRCGYNRNSLLPDRNTWILLPPVDSRTPWIRKMRISQ